MKNLDLLQDITVCDKCRYTRLTKGSQLYFGCLCTLDLYWTNIVEVYCHDCEHMFASLAVLIECPYCEGKQITLKLCQRRNRKLQNEGANPDYDTRGNKPQQRYYCENCDLKLSSYGDMCDHCGHDNLPF